MGYQTITKYDTDYEVKNTTEAGRIRTCLHRFKTKKEALRHAQEECRWEATVESIVVCETNNLRVAELTPD
jgi:hypothetical protein